MINPLLLSALAVIATLSPVLRQRSAQRRLEWDRQAAVPEFVDLVRLAVGSGTSVHQVLDAVVDHAPSPFMNVVHEVQRRVSLGERLGDALDAFDSLGESTRPLASALRASAFDGVPLGPALDRVATDARLQRRRSAEISARRLPVQLLFPLVLCVLPAFGLLAVVPLLVSSLGSLHF